MNCSIPNKTVTINDKDAPWITPEVKQAIKKNHRVYSKWNKHALLGLSAVELREIPNHWL